MSTKFVLPKEPAVMEMLGMLYGGDLELKPGKALDASAGNVVAVYIDDDGAPVAAGICDAAFAAYAGSALSMIPAGGAQDAAESGELSGAMVDNLNEVMNVCSRLLMGSSTPHLKLDKVYADIAVVSDDAKAMVSAASQRVDYEIAIPRYGSGCMSLVTT